MSDLRSFNRDLRELLKRSNGKVKIVHKPEDEGKLWHFGLDTEGNIIKIIPENVVLDIKKGGDK